MTVIDRFSYLQFFRVLLPSWKFFDDIALMPELWIRIVSKETEKDKATWIKALPKIGSRSWERLFVNTKEIETFAYHSLLDHFVMDCEDKADSAVSLALVENLARKQAKDLASLSTRTVADHFQFKMTLGTEVVFTSFWKELS